MPGDQFSANGHGDAGSIQSMEHVAAWVRFADTKATILTAGFGVLLTALMSKVATLINAITIGCWPAISVGIPVAVTVLAAAWTLYWVVSAVSPRVGTYRSELNRFAWPSLSRTTVTEVQMHVSQVALETDAWNQAVQLATIADRKFAACRKAVQGFAVLAASSPTAVVVAEVWVSSIG